MSVMAFDTLVRPDLVLFDWDNTLVDTAPLVQAALNHTLRSFGLAAFDAVQLEAAMNLSMRDHFPKLFGESWMQARDSYYRYYDTHVGDYLKPKGAAESCLQHICEHHIGMGVVSNKRGVLLRHEVTLMQWDSYFFAAVGSGDAEHDKPSSALFQTFLEHSELENTKPQRVWLIGDSLADMQFAHNIGASGIYVGERREGKQEELLQFAHVPIAHLGEIKIPTAKIS